MNLGYGSKYLSNTCVYYFYMLTKFWRKCEHSGIVVTSTVSQQTCWAFGIRPFYWK